MTPHDSWRTELDSFLAASPPRRLPAPILKAAAPLKAHLLLLLFGSVFLIIGLFFCYIFLPTHLPDQRRLAAGPSATAAGRILTVEKTKLSLNEVSVWQYRFTYQPAAGPARQGTAYTTGRRWNKDSRVTVTYLTADPALAVPAGARLGKGDTTSLLVLIFPTAGAAIVLSVFLSRHRKKRLLRHGRVCEATLHRIEKTNTEVNDLPLHKIHLTLADVGTPQVRSTYDPKELAWLEKSLRAASPVKVLYHHKNPRRLLFPRSWRP